MTLAELLTATLVISIVAAVAAPSYRRNVFQTRATKMVADCQAVRAAAHMYKLDALEWPDDARAGRVPPELEPYLSGVDFVGAGYELDWERWDLPEGPLLGITMVIEDPALEASLVGLARSFGPLWQMDNRYTLFIEGAEAAGFVEAAGGEGVGGGIGAGRWLNRGRGRRN